MKDLVNFYYKKQAKFALVILKISLLFLCFANTAIAQKPLTPEIFWEGVSLQHPLIQRAALLQDRTKAQQLMAFGGFDPLVYAYYNSKDFKNKNYYTLLESGIKIPTIIGAEVKINYEINGGNYLNPESTTPQRGLATVGVTMPLLQGLLFDERRAALQQASIYEKANAQERRVQLNNFAYEAFSAYWEWTLAQQRFRITSQALLLSETRFKATKQAIAQGDRAAIDSIEARLAVSQFKALRANFMGDVLAAERVLYNYLPEQNIAKNDNNPNNAVLVKTNLEALSVRDLRQMPQSPAFYTATTLADSLQKWQVSMLQQHPELQVYALKLQDLAVEMRLKREKLKPKLNVTYNLLSEEWRYGDAKYGAIYDNYKLGVALSYPILTRTERGNTAMTDIKIRDTEFLSTQKRRELLNKVEAYYQEWFYNLEELKLYDQYTKDNETLASAERIRFENGESSLFLINSREQKLVEAQLKQAELLVKHFKYLASLRWAMGGF